MRGASMAERRSSISTPGRIAFTLIEVLVVVAIIALLIAILLPALSRVRWQSRCTACRGHLHDLGLAFVMYAEAYRGYFPVVPDYNDSYWSLRAANLLKDPDVLICPATRNTVRPETLRNPVVYVRSLQDNVTMIPLGTSDIDRTASKGRDDGSGGHSYEYNGFYGGERNQHPLAKHHKRTQHFKFAAHEMLLAHDNDQAIFGGEGCSGSQGVMDNPPNPGNNCPQSWDNHGSEGMNMMFADGHAAWTPKVKGIYQDLSRTPPMQRLNDNASIDRVWLKSSMPWLFSN